MVKSNFGRYGFRYKISYPIVKPYRTGIVKFCPFSNLPIKPASKLNTQPSAFLPSGFGRSKIINGIESLDSI